METLDEIELYRKKTRLEDMAKTTSKDNKIVDQYGVCKWLKQGSQT